MMFFARQEKKKRNNIAGASRKDKNEAECNRSDFVFTKMSHRVVEKLPSRKDKSNFLRCNQK